MDGNTGIAHDSGYIFPGAQIIPADAADTPSQGQNNAGANHGFYSVVKGFEKFRHRHDAAGDKQEKCYKQCASAAQSQRSGGICFTESLN